MINDAGKKKKILLVDDDDIQLTTAELFLKNEYEIYKAISGEEALKLLNAKEVIPDLIMLDILMPNMNGWEVFSRIKAINFLKDIPIVFLTSLEGDAEKKRAHKMGACDYIIKPYNMTDLKSRIKEVIKK
jgi:putative two-component system response regulator